ncbi:MAG: hypothetical protein JNM66_02500 [Bryobacterales bacterium]|nr:hypothetical protein [Bryobacterales bacterium]
MSETAIHLERLIARRVRGVEAAARREILICIVAALFFAAVVAWRFGYVPWVALVWSAAALYRFRREIWRPAAGEMAVTGLAHYRAVLAGRRDLLRQAWLWQGPLLLSCGTLAVVALGQAHGGLARWRNMAPFLTLLAVWVVLAMVLRRREAAELQREIDELGPGGA